jgi:hypothetical protein
MTAMKTFLLQLAAYCLCYCDVPAPEWVGRVEGMPAALRAVALSEEWVGPGEPLAWYTYPGYEPTFDSQLAFCRAMRELLADAPRLASGRRLPDCSFACRQAEFGEQHVNYARAVRAITGPRDHAAEDWLREAELLHDFWDRVVSATFPGRACRDRRAALRDLADAIGLDDLERGNLPPAVPVWRFRRID